MTNKVFRLGAISLGLALAVVTVPLKAQWVVYDPTNYAEAVVQYEQLIREYALLVKQALRLPVDMGTRYRASSPDWTTHDLAGVEYALPLLGALNAGDATGAAYRRAAYPLDVPTDVVGRMPADMQRRLATAYATIELADHVARLAVDQSGTVRADGPPTLQAIRHVEQDVANPADDFQAQTALLQKMDAALAIDLRLNEQTNHIQLSALEQAIVENKRQRDAEATLMNATIHQWRYGKAYGDDLFSHTAADINTWRPY